MIREIVSCILGILCLVYGLIVFGTRSGTGSFLIWIVLGILLLGLMTTFHFHMWDKIPAFLHRIIIIVVLIVIIMFIAVEGCIISGFSAKGEENLDYIVVLGAQVKANGPSRVLQYRLDEAYDYLIENEGTICIVSGGQGHNEPFSEAQGMYDYLVDKGISAERILMEDRSANTVQNLENSSKYFDSENDRIGVVTNNFHVFRGVHLAKHLGIKNVYGIAAKAHPLYLPNNMLREFFGVAKDLLYGNLF